MLSTFRFSLSFVQLLNKHQLSSKGSDANLTAIFALFRAYPKTSLFGKKKSGTKSGMLKLQVVA
jgi:hypothetical protein